MIWDVKTLGLQMSYFIICLISFFVAVLTLFSGFGLGTILLPVFSIFFPIEVAVAATALVHVANNIFKLFLVGHMANAWVTLKFAIPAAITSAFGAWLLMTMGNLPDLASYELFGYVFHITPIKLIIGVFILIFSLFEFLPFFQKASFSKKYVSLGGAISGFFGGLSGLQGALRSMFLIRSGLNKNQFIGTSVLSSIIVDVSRLLVYGTHVLGSHVAELKKSGVLSLVVVASMAAFAGSVLGARLLKTTTLKTVQKIVALLLIVLGLALIGGLI